MSAAATGSPARRVPRSPLKLVRNLTPFVDFHASKMGPGRLFFDTVVLKGTFDLLPGDLRVADRQAPVALADEPFDPDKDARSSLRRAGDLLLGKPGTDVFVTGTARAPGGVPARAWTASVEVTGGRGPDLRHEIQALGPRVWQHRRIAGWTLGDPDPATSVPIRYELAYGGAYRDPDAAEDEAWRLHDPNPSGLGFVDARALDRDRTYPAPQWQSRAEPVTAMNTPVALAGFGPIPRPWGSRHRYAGTYDDAWMQKAKEDTANGLPVDYPADFDFRFFQCAHPDLTSPAHLAGDERIALTGLSAQAARLETRLPGIIAKARLFRPRATRCLETTMNLDTVHIDVDASRIHLTWRLTLDQAIGTAGVLLFAEAMP